MKPTFKNIHLRFRWNGYYFDRDGLKEVAYSLVKEGAPYEQSIGDFMMDWLDNKEYLDVKTSGSTGIPKTVRIWKQHMVHSALATGDFFDISVGDSALHCLPAEFIAGKMMLVRALILGLEIDLIPPSASPLSEIIKEYDFSAMIPLQVENSLDKLEQIKTLIVGGAPVGHELKTELNTKTTKIFETYGMTETVTHIAARPLNEAALKTKGKAKGFVTMPHVQISTDERECLVVDAPDISENTVVTNDIVKILSENEFEWLGRYDYIINSGGIKLIPEQIESKLDPFIESRFFVTGIPDTALGSKMIMIVEGTTKNETELLEVIKESNVLSKYEVPKEIHFIPHFTETENGKVVRTATLDKIKTKH
ncbi:AMP-binding protein [Ascidiimonas aurantiaca]|uniref:AMP-binding protein n=1 Tax=Ascidiimonas aurantiaca TaxID=1685432 RepID=UPI0030EDF6FD